ncbi:MAG: hypothetical protein QE263_04625 [Vampirovibrionales bacterium]|nr:hypothetical protein [Vampirovibrionales bacterium]
MGYVMQAGASVDAYELTGPPSNNNSGGNPYAYSDPYVFYTPVSQRPATRPLQQYNAQKDPMSNSYMGGGWEDDPSIFSNGLLGALRPFDFVPDNGWYDPQLDDIAATDPYSNLSPNPPNPKDNDLEKAKEAAKKAAANGGNGTNGGNGSGNPQQPQPFGGTPDTEGEPRPWWHWAALLGGGGLAVWYLTKKKKKGKG